MAINMAGGAEASLSVFGGLCTEMVPVDLPEGVSPDNQDVVYLPGSVASRPGLQKVFATPFPTVGGPGSKAPTVNYGKSFVTPTGAIENLYLDSNGSLWWEDLTNTPGTYAQLGSFASNSYGKSITAFGREYIALSDTLHGSDIPLQWDGTNLDRVTQDGPGTAPLVASIALPSVALTASSPITFNITEADPVGPVFGGGFSQINLFTAGPVTGINVGQPCTVAGYSGSSAAMNGAWLIQAVYGGGTGGYTYLVILTAFTPAGTVSSLAAATGTVPGGALIRQGNVISATTATAHQLQVGYQVQISGVAAFIVASAIGTPPAGAIVSIVINNGANPGIATITTTTAHGLLPGNQISLTGVTAVTVGTSISSASWAGGIVTVTTSAAHGLVPGAQVSIAATGGGAAAFNVTTAILSVKSSTIFTYALTPLTAPADATGGTITLNWPIPDLPEPTYFEVLAAPTPTTLQIQLSYSDGTWTTGIITFGWNGTFYVSAVPSSTTFQYQQYGPNASVGATMGQQATPWGQIAPGIKQCQVLFLTRQGYLTKPSPPVKVEANGGQYLSVTNIPIGPSNVIARVLAFTGAGGSYFFYIPTPAQVAGQIVSTATQINDNTSTNAFLDFGDNTLFSSLGISIPGNNPAAQIVIDGALGFGFYASRLITWGQRNRIQNLLNMGFEGGYLPSSSTLPTGWTVASTGGSLGTGHYAQGWVITVPSGGAQAGGLSQSMYQDAYCAPIAQPNTPYLFRVWLKPSLALAGLTFHAVISSASTSFTSSVTFVGTAMKTAGSFLQGAFSLPMAAVVPSDLIFQIYATNSGGSSLTLTVDEMSIIYAQNPYSDTICYGSYVDNPEAFDGVTGKFGASQDTRKIMDFGVIRQTMNFLTQEPSGRLHQTSDNGVTEPSGWNVSQVASSCGLLSAFALTKSQADDASASGGEEWMAWASSSGARIFGGDQPAKISQEIQPDWNSIYPGSQTTAWALNDPVGRVIYFGIPVVVAQQLLGPNIIYPVDYKELDTAYQISTSAPIHTSFSGHLIATDHTRKWTRWNLACNGGALMYRSAGNLSVVFFGGQGKTVNHANAYVLSPLMLTDDDYGQIFPYYTTYFFVSREQEQALGYTDDKGQKQQLGAGRKLIQYVTAFISGTGQISLTYYPNSLTNPWPLSVTRALTTVPIVDLECGGGSAIGNRIAIKLASSPVGVGVTNNGFNLQRVTTVLKVAARLPIRGSL